MAVKNITALFTSPKLPCHARPYLNVLSGLRFPGMKLPIRSGQRPVSYHRIGIMQI